MKEDQMLAVLSQFNIGEYIQSARIRGRAQVTQETRARAVALYEQMQHFCVDQPFISKQLAAMLDLAGRVLFSEWFFANNPLPRYPAYTNIHVLNWVLGTNQRVPWNNIRQRCWRVIDVLLQDLLSFEVCSLARVENWQQQNCDPDVVSQRIVLLQEIARQIRNKYVELPARVRLDIPPEDWFSYASDETRTYVLLHLTALPQTQEHDEFLFLRTIHISECIFWAILSGVIAGIESAKGGDLEQATVHVADAASFAQLLVPIFIMFKTMPPEHFAIFRDATGNASAIQSRTYQLMQIFTGGLDERKVDYLSDAPETADLLFYGHPGFLDLRAVVRMREQTIFPQRDDFIASVEALDKALYAWRCLHLGIARNYLPAPSGTGGTPGAPYLEMIYRRKILPAIYQGAPWPELHVIKTVHAHPVLSRFN